MGREHVIQSWVKHDEDDWRKIPDALLNDASGYSGEQVGQRIAPNNGNTRIRSTVPGYLPNGRADIAGAADPIDEAKSNPLVLVDPAFKILLEYPAKVEALEAARAGGLLSESSYKTALRILDVKADKAQRKLYKLQEHILLEEEEDPEPDDEAPILEEYQLLPYDPTPEEAEEALRKFMENN